MQTQLNESSTTVNLRQSYEFPAPAEDRPLRVVELFSGIGAQAMALRGLGVPFTSVTCEVDRHAIASYRAIHGDTPNLGDITEVTELPECDLLTYSFPCIRGDQRVVTGRGAVPIRDVTVGDTVLTHRGRWRRVTAHAMTGVHGTVRVTTPMNDLVCTRDHMVWTRWNLGNNHHAEEDGHTRRRFTAPYWAPATSLTSDNYVAFPVNTTERMFEWEGLTQTYSDGRVYRRNDLSGMMGGPDLWWLCGRYVADGWLRSQGGIVIAVGKGKESDVERMDRVFHVSVSEEATCTKVHIPRRELEMFCDTLFGHGAGDKHIDRRVLDLPRDLLRAFLDGYLSGDGHFSEEDGTWSCNSVSEQLVRDLQEVIAKVCHAPARYTFTERPETAFIEGREVRQQDTHTLRWKEEARAQDKMFYEDGVIWVPVRSVESLNPTSVYDISVEEDESFVVEGIAVHNCQSLSISGRQDGMAEGSGTKSSLAWEVIRLLRTAETQGRLPRWLVMENVKGLLSRRNTAEFARLRAELEDMGYTNSWSVLNAMDFGVPQKRERVFMVSSLDGRVFSFPEGARTELRLRDLLEAPEDVDPSLFLSDEKVARYEEHARRHREAGHGLGWRPREGDGMSPTVLTNPTKGETNTIIVSGTLGGYEQTSRVYDPSGVSLTVTTPAGGGHIPAILYPEGTKKGYREAHEGDGLVMPRPTLARGTVQCDCTPTLTTGGGCGTGTVVADGGRLRIRYLSPRECWRLMGQPDWAYDRAVEAGVSRTQLYRQAGNSIVVPVLEAVFGAMLSEDSWRRDPQSRLEVGQ